jgi:hypothetical protein
LDKTPNVIFENDPAVVAMTLREVAFVEVDFRSDRVDLANFQL